MVELVYFKYLINFQCLKKGFNFWYFYFLAGVTSQSQNHLFASRPIYTLYCSKLTRRFTRTTIVRPALCQLAWSSLSRCKRDSFHPAGQRQQTTSGVTIWFRANSPVFSIMVRTLSIVCDGLFGATSAAWLWCGWSPSCPGRYFLFRSATVKSGLVCLRLFSEKKAAFCRIHSVLWSIFWGFWQCLSWFILVDTFNSCFFCSKV